MSRKNPISKQEIEKIEYLIEDIRNGKLILDHPLQRSSENWSSEQKGNLIRRVLHEGQFLPILICTQFDEYGCEVRYLIDGVQRITTFDEFLKDKFPISKNTIEIVKKICYNSIVNKKYGGIPMPMQMTFRWYGEGNDRIKLSDIKGEVVTAIPYVGLILSFIRSPLGIILILGTAFFLMERSFRKEKEESLDELEQIKEEIRRLQAQQEAQDQPKD